MTIFSTTSSASISIPRTTPLFFFTWQGGEPTLAGLDFYRRVIELQKKHARAGITIANSIQTNGVLLDENWCQFLAEHHWPVGISIDGPADIHDAYRHTRNGSGSFAQVRQAIDLLHKYHIRFDTLTTVTPLNVHRVEELYQFIFRELRPAVASVPALRRAEGPCQPSPPATGRQTRSCR